MRALRCIRPSLLLTACLALSAQAYVTKTGNVSGQTWGIGTYYVTGSLTVNNGTTLTLEPGAVVKFAPGTGATINGTLNAPGTESLPIVITGRDDDDWGDTITGSDGSPQPGDWLGIQCYGYSGNAGIGHFDHCLLRYGGATAGAFDANLYCAYSDAGSFTASTSEFSQNSGVRVLTCSPVLTDSHLHGNGTHGLSGSGGGSPLVTSCNFTDNGQYGAWLSNIDIVSSGGNMGSGNGVNGLGLSGTIAGNPIMGPGAPGFPYILIGTVTVPSTLTLRLDPGTVAKAASAGEIYVLGSLVLAGTADSLVVLTSLQDDSIDGDSNGDGAATQPAPGDWKGIHCYGYSGNQGIALVDHSRLRYGGSTATSYDANLALDYSDSAHFLNSASEYSQDAGLRSSYCSTDIAYSQFSGNLGRGISATAGDTPVVNHCIFTGNGGYGAWISGIPLRAYSDNSGSGNGVNGFGLQGTVSASVAWSANAAGFPYVLTGTVTVNSSQVLDLGAGLVMKGAPGGDFDVNGTLNANGTAGNPVVITSLKDDTVDGDTNADGGASLPAPGDWDGIYCYGYSGSQGIGAFDWCTLRYGGSTSTNWDANLQFAYSDSGHFTNSVSEYSQDAGVRIVTCVPVLAGSQFNHSLGNGIHAASVNAPIVTACTFTGNGGYGAWLSGVLQETYSGNGGSGNGVNGFGVSGTVGANRSWGAGGPGFPYVLIGALTVNSGATLALAPGLVMKALPAGELDVDGTLNAGGTEESPLVVTSLKDDSIDGDTNMDGAATQPSPGDWRGIYCNGYSGAQGIGNFDWCRLRYGGATATSWDANLYYAYSDAGHFVNSASEYSQDAGIHAAICVPTITDSQFSNNTGHGILANSTSAPVVNGCVFTDNGGHGAWFSGVTLPACGGNSGSGNGVNGIGMAGTVAGSVNWAANGAGFPYVLTGIVTVNNGSTLTLDPGVVIKAGATGELDVDGALHALGTAGAPIRFTSLKDDDWDGDTNMDGAATLPAGGDWRGIYCYGYSSNQGQGQFQHCEIRYGGGGPNGAALRFYDSAPSTFQDGLIQSSVLHGIRVVGCSPVVGGSEITGNAGYGVFIEGGTPVLGATDDSQGGYNTISGNNGLNYQVWNQSGTVVQACYNDWGFYTPELIDQHIRDNEEGGAANEVIFSPFVKDTGSPWITHCSATAEAFTLWFTPVLGAVGYQVYGSDWGFTGFTPDDSGSFVRSHWTAPLSGLKRFYQVRAVFPDDQVDGAPRAGVDAGR